MPGKPFVRVRSVCLMGNTAAAATCCHSWFCTKRAGGAGSAQLSEDQPNDREHTATSSQPCSALAPSNTVRAPTHCWQGPQPPSSKNSKKSRTQIYMDLSYIDPQAKVLKYCYK